MIEAGGRNLREQEALRDCTREVFETVVDLLRAKGEFRRDLIFWKYQNLSHTVNSAEPPIQVFMWTSANLDKASKVTVEVEGIPNPFVVKKKTKNGVTIFSGRKTFSSLDQRLSEAQGYLEAVKRVAQEVSA